MIKQWLIASLKNAANLLLGKLPSKEHEEVWKVFTQMLDRRAQIFVLLRIVFSGFEYQADKYDTEGLENIDGIDAQRA